MFDLTSKGFQSFEPSFAWLLPLNHANYVKFILNFLGWHHHKHSKQTRPDLGFFGVTRGGILSSTKGFVISAPFHWPPKRCLCCAAPLSNVMSKDLSRLGHKNIEGP